MTEFLAVKNGERAAEVAALADKIWKEYYTPVIGKEQVDYMLSSLQSAEAIERAVREGTEYYLVRCDGMAVGYMAVKNEGERLFLSKLYTICLARKRGIGKACLLYAAELAKKCGCKEIYLTVNKNNLYSIEFYSRQGYKIREAVKSDIGGGFYMDDYIMYKTLPSADSVR